MTERDIKQRLLNATGPTADFLSTLLEEIEAVFDHPNGAAGRCADIETFLGHTLLPVGTTTPIPIPVDDWVENSVISLNGKEVRLVIVSAKHERSGAFTRLLAEIERAGLTPVICAPIGRVMPMLMRKWGWIESVRGEGFMRCEEWRPA
jgi:hypothetical protein